VKQVYQDGVVSALDSSVTLNDNQYGALVSWCYNVGAGAVAESTLAARLNAGEDPNTVAEEELIKWVYANGEVSEGLKRRRNAEIELFQTSSDGEALPVSC
jgi:lysozyme